MAEVEWMREVSGSWSFLASLGSRGVSEPNYICRMAERGGERRVSEGERERGVRSGGVREEWGVVVREVEGTGVRCEVWESEGGKGSGGEKKRGEGRGGKEGKGEGEGRSGEWW